MLYWAYICGNGTWQTASLMRRLAACRWFCRLFGATGYCSACTKMIPAFEMVMKAKGNVYHLECFACQHCNHRSLVYSDFARTCRCCTAIGNQLQVFLRLLRTAMAIVYFVDFTEQHTTCTVTRRWLACGSF